MDKGKFKLLLLNLSLINLIVFSQSALAYDESKWRVSDEGTWRITDDIDYKIAKGSASKLLSLDESVRHREISLKIQENIVDSFIFSCGCMLQSKTPVISLKVPYLDIRMEDQNKGYVFARFLVDDNQEFSLRGTVQKNGKIIFAPFTKTQDQKLSDLFLQLREGGTLQIALLQGKTMEPRLYKVPLTGFMPLSDALVSDCANLNKIGAQVYKYELLPDYLTQEGEDYAPEDYSLKFDDNKVDIEMKKEVEQDEVPEVDNTPDPIINFTPDGSPASIGPDGKPIGVETSNNDGADTVATDNSANTSAQGNESVTAPDSIGTVQESTMQIDENGNPIFN